MEAEQPPVYIVSLGRVYRRDTPDATHVPIFHQVEGLAVDRGITLADLKGTLLHLMRALFGEERQVRFRTHYFPFTEPSIEPDVSCFLCDGEGCRVCKFSGWIEMGGAGMVDPGALQLRRLRPRGGLGLRVRPRPRADRHAPARAARPARALAERPAAPRGSSEMKVPVSWLREYVAFTAPIEDVARAARDRVAPRSNASPAAACRTRTATSGASCVGRVVEAGKHPNADRLQLCQVDVGEPEPRQIVCGAWNFGAGATVAVALPGAVLPDGRTLERSQAARLGLRRDDPVRAGARSRDRALRDPRAARGAEPGTPLARRRPAQ